MTVFNKYLFCQFNLNAQPEEFQDDVLQRSLSIENKC